MIKNYLKVKYIGYMLLYFFMILFSFYNNMLFLVIFLNIWLLLYMFRIIWFLKLYSSLKKYIILLIIEDIFIFSGFIFMYFTSNNNNIEKNSVNIFYCLSFLIFLIPTFIFHNKFNKFNKISCDKSSL